MIEPLLEPTGITLSRTKRVSQRVGRFTSYVLEGIRPALARITGLRAG